MAVTLNFLRRDEKPLPGQVLLAQVHTVDDMRFNPLQPYWPVLVLDRSLAPLEVERSAKPACSQDLDVDEDEEYLVWLIGMGRFFWVPQLHFHELHDSQLEVLKGRPEGEDFAAIYKLVGPSNLAQSLKKFEVAVRRDAECINTKIRAQNAQSKKRTMPILRGNGAFDDETMWGVSDDEDSSSSRKRTRSNKTTTSDIHIPESSERSSSTIASARPGSTSIRVSDSLPRLVIIKKEPGEESGTPSPPGEGRVQVYVGEGIHEQRFSCARSDLLKSAKFTSYITHEPDAKPFIMHPSLKPINPSDFKALVEYMQTEEYTPCLINVPCANGRERLALNGLYSEKDYAHELIHSGRLHVFAKHFGLSGLSELIVKKVTRAHVHRYSAYALLELTRKVFSIGGHQQGEEDPLEGWLAEKLAEEIESITKGQGKLFWEVVRAAVKRRLAVKVLRRKADLDEAFPGGLVKVEDDD